MKNSSVEYINYLILKFRFWKIKNSYYELDMDMQCCSDMSYNDYCQEQLLINSEFEKIENKLKNNKYYNRYKVVEINPEQFGRKSKVFVISKRKWHSLFRNTNIYFFNEEAANSYCDRLNNKK